MSWITHQSVPICNKPEANKNNKNQFRSLANQEQQEYQESIIEDQLNTKFSDVIVIIIIKKKVRLSLVPEI